MERNTEDIDKIWTETLSDSKNAVPKAPDFKFFISTFGLQAAIFLGVIENPATKKKEENLPQAKFIIDTLNMLKQKTKGNLNTEETEILDTLLCELRAQYISKAKKPNAREIDKRD